MRSIFLFSVLILITTTLAGQDSPATFSWGLTVYPNLSDRRLIAFRNISEQMVRELDEKEISRFSWSAGWFGGWKGQKAGFQFGLNFMDTGYRTQKEPFPADEPNPDGATERRFVYQNYHIEIPVELLFIHPFKNGSAFHFMMGGSLSFNLSNNEQTVLFFGDSREVETAKPEQGDFRRINYAFQTGLGYEKNLSESFSLFVQPTFQFWLKGILNDNELNRNLYAFGIKLGGRLR